MIPISSLLVLLLTGAVSFFVDGKVSPHGDSKACASCHGPVAPGTSSEAIPWAQGTIDKTCGSCHDYEHHQVGVSKGQTHPPASFPLSGGLLTCATCHDEPACQHEKLDGANPMRFRGGPYPRIATFCALCHNEKKAGEPFNLHQAMDPARPASTCAFCHLDAPSPEARVGDLRIPSITVCTACHTTNVHAGAAAHVGKVPARMHQKAHEARLPLAEDGTMGCVTCHDPHPVGVRPGSELRGYWIGKEVVDPTWKREVLEPSLQADARILGTSLETVTVDRDFLRLPARNGRLCLVCHTWQDITPGTR